MTEQKIIQEMKGFRQKHRFTPGIRQFHAYLQAKQPRVGIYVLRGNDFIGYKRSTRVWFSDSLRGRMFVQFVALGYYCFLMGKIKELKETLGTDPQLKQTQREDELGLKRWLEQRSLWQIFDWFDYQEETCIQTETGRKRWASENTQRDRLLLSKLGIQ